MSVPIPSDIASTGSAPAAEGSSYKASGNWVVDGINWLTNLIFGISDRKNQRDVQAQNQSNWQKQFDYQTELNKLLMNREDNAYQRTVSDMRKAGLNPLSLTSASTNTLSGHSGNSGNSASSHAMNLTNNPLQTLQDNYYRSLQANNETKLASAQAADLQSQARHRDIQSQVLEASLPESLFKKSVFEDMSDEDKSRYANAYKNALIDNNLTPGLQNEGLKQSNQSQKLQNQLMEATLQDKIYQEQLKSIQLNEEIKKLQSGRAKDISEIKKQREEIKNLQEQRKKISAEIKSIQNQAELLGLDVFYREQTQGDLINAINKNNKRSQTILWNLYGAGASVSPYGVSVNGTNLTPKK